MLNADLPLDRKVFFIYEPTRYEILDRFLGDA